MNTSPGASRVVRALRSALLALVALVAAAACDLSLDDPGFTTSGAPDGTVPETTTDAPWTGGGATDPTEVQPRSSGPLPTDTRRNGCGGGEPLRLDGAAVPLLEPCGAFEEGRVVCDGLDALRCVDTAPRNVCGWAGTLAVEPGAPCGVCGDGTWRCGVDPDRPLVCAGATAPNGCGGCEPLGGRPGAGCDAEAILVCESPDRLVCAAAANPCGGAEPLAYAGSPAAPGERCETGCGTGILVCDGSEQIRCVPDDSSPPENACGGCAMLVAEPETGCGPCGRGLWQCADGGDRLRCDGTAPADPCGGCRDDGAVPGEPCDDGRVWLCRGREIVCAAVVDPGQRNACGGSLVLAGDVGDACGVCGVGRLQCDGLDDVVCDVPDDAQRNACGGCGGPAGTVDAPCGTCGSGLLQCENDQLSCVGNLGPGARNACGGCRDLEAAPGSSCGTCLVWTCVEDDVLLRCVPVDDAEACVDRVTCDGLGCDEQGRTCREADSLRDAACLGCLPGYSEDGPRCVPDSGGTGEPSEPAGSCDDEDLARCLVDNRRCVASPDPACRGCVDWTVERAGECLPVLRCASLACGDESRTCIPAEPDRDAACGPCVPTHVEIEGRCTERLPAPDGVTASRGTDPEHVEVTWDPVVAAAGYHVYRDGVRLTVDGPVTERRFLDSGAPSGGPPPVTEEVVATTDRTDGVALRWSESTPGVGPERVYTVRAVAGGNESLPSTEANGFRGAWPILRYEVIVTNAAGTDWTDVGLRTEWVDVDAPLGTLPVGVPTATTDREDGVQLGLAAVAPQPGSQRVYRVRAVSAGGAASPSGEATGRRAVGAVSYLWQWAGSRDGAFATLPGSGSRMAADTFIGSGETRWYRVRVRASGAAEAFSVPVEGRRPWAVPACETHAQCGAGFWCPEDTQERRCAPSPSFPGGVGMRFQYVPAGQFVMGSPPGELGRFAGDNREFQRPVALTRPFWMQRTPVTRRQWTAIAGRAPAEAMECEDDCPVERVTWFSALWFANEASIAEGLDPCYDLSVLNCSHDIATHGPRGDLACTANQRPSVRGGNVYACEGYRLPTEAEWEYAVRAGTTTATWLGNLVEPIAFCQEGPSAQPNLDPIAWWCRNRTSSGPQRVERLAPNFWGLHDMLGNVHEWVWDSFILSPGAEVDPSIEAVATVRVRRGGWHGEHAGRVRAAQRDGVGPMNGQNVTGLRLVRTALPAAR